MLGMVFESFDGDTVVVAEGGRTLVRDAAGLWRVVTGIKVGDLYSDFKSVDDNSKAEALAKEGAISVAV